MSYSAVNSNRYGIAFVSSVLLSSTAGLMSMFCHGLKLGKRTRAFAILLGIEHKMERKVNSTTVTEHHTSASVHS